MHSHLDDQDKAASLNKNNLPSEPGMRVLVMTAVQVEREAVLRGLCGADRSADSVADVGPTASFDVRLAGVGPAVASFDVRLAGVGPAAAAASTATALASGAYDLVVSAGIGGGFAGIAEVGSLVVASEIVAADLGVQTAEGFRSLHEMGFGTSRCLVDANLASRVTKALRAAGLPVSMGSVLTVSTATGTAAAASELADRVPGAAAEAMEGFGVATAAEQHGVPILELRAISNRVGPRDRSAWRIPEALQALEAAFTVLREVLL
jgi:futalosine hydrolase